MVEPQKCFTEEYVAQVVHDLKTPVLAIGGYARRLREEKLGPLNERQKAALDTILDTADRLDHDLAWIVEHARAGRFVWEEAQYERFDLRDHTARVVETVRALAEQKGIAVDLDLPAEPVEVRADPRMMERSVSELVHNALKHSPEGERVKISLKAGGGTVELAVSDRGEGFDPGKLQQIFRPWEQVIQIEDRRIRGVGLGLANVKHYAEAHGGEVQAETSPGEGSTFRLVLPLSGDAAESPPENPENAERGEG